MKKNRNWKCFSRFLRLLRLHAYICTLHCLLARSVPGGLSTNALSSQHIHAPFSPFGRFVRRCPRLSESAFSARRRENSLFFSPRQICNSESRSSSRCLAAITHANKDDTKPVEQMSQGEDKTTTSSLCSVRNGAENRSRHSISRTAASLLHRHLQPSRTRRRKRCSWSQMRQVGGHKPSLFENRDSATHRESSLSPVSAVDVLRFDRRNASTLSTEKIEQQLLTPVSEPPHEKALLRTGAPRSDIRGFFHVFSHTDGRRRHLLHIEGLVLHRMHKPYHMRTVNGNSAKECIFPLNSTSDSRHFLAAVTSATVARRYFQRRAPFLHIIPPFHTDSSCSEKTGPSLRYSDTPMKQRDFSARDYVAGSVMEKLLTAEEKDRHLPAQVENDEYLLPGSLPIAGLPYCAKVGEIPGDGDCLFIALAACLWYSVFGAHSSLRTPAFKDMTYNLRQLAVDTLERPPVPSFTLEENEEVSPSELLRRASETYGLSPAAYLNRLRLPGSWGGGPEIVALSHALKRTICVYEIDFSSLTQNRSPPSAPTATPGAHESSYTASHTDVFPTSPTRSVGAEIYPETHRLPPRMSAEALCKGKPLKLVACVGYPTNIADEPLHILFINSAQGSPPTSSTTRSGDHFMPLFPCIL